MISLRASHAGGPFRVVVGVTGGIAAYKACTLVRILVKAGIDVTVVPTHAALDMVGATTWEALSGKPVYVDVTDDAPHVTHVRLGKEADLVVVAPTTAHTLAKVSAGLADNLLTSTLLVATCPVMLVPAMHTEMWLNPATQTNVATLRSRGIDVVEPAVGRLTGPDSGPGRMPEPETIASLVFKRLGMGEEAEEAVPESAPIQDLAGLKIAISAGGTREAIDPVRFIGNNSTGSFGAHLSAEASRRGASTRFVGANVSESVVKLAATADVVEVVSTEQLMNAMDEAAHWADVVVMSAAVADFRPEVSHASKQKKSGAKTRTLTLVENPDILAELAHHRRREGQLVMGFAAETGDSAGTVLEYGQQKARRKGADLMVINEVGTGKGFGEIPTVVTIVDGAGNVIASGRGTKADVSRVILDAVASVRSGN
ncbi:bifunctional phosphopantothenoylcysteine decarboxylase/phosphopantothenate--cysteine ligase CoaBC [Changpingibacter yushuensis]|uniref:bifunctional phosphopantothenoylcysteine decarboxylase/phosphopantothenate--cysteine ligase CoaBC n=1 Tax=Changpingibacter yushuensis TaxID=2758440 RepID=UPI0015F62357|nr:bifunctional phosphopantothenoylcysteine decarboxylase/phosphopantothenate--cysteine ligase CoaBC [Changpingibacter yushuensis]